MKKPSGEGRTAHLPARQEMMRRWADYLDKLAAGAEIMQFKAARQPTPMLKIVNLSAITRR